VFSSFRNKAPLFSVLLTSVCIVSATRHARADVSSWLAIHAGAAQVRALDFDQTLAPTLRLGTGMGTDPSHPWVVGALFQTETLMGHGTDLSFLLRLADHGFVNGEWGFALDAGPLARFWGQDRYGGAAVFTVGGPWGLQAGINASMGTDDLRSVGVFAGIDLARLTVYRRSGKSWWKNTFPAYRTAEEQAH
jgi:hypothetical protein